MHINHFLVLLVVIIATLCSTSVADANDINPVNTLGQNSNHELLANAGDITRRSLKGSNKPSEATESDEERAIPKFDKLDDILIKSSSFTKLKPLAGKQADFTKLKTLSKSLSEPDLKKLKSLTTGNKLDLRKVKSFADKDPKLSKLKSLVGTNPKKLTPDQIKSAEAYVAQNPSTGPFIVKAILGGLGFAVFAGIISTIVVLASQPLATGYN